MKINGLIFYIRNATMERFTEVNY